MVWRFTSAALANEPIVNESIPSPKTSLNPVPRYRVKCLCGDLELEAWRALRMPQVTRYHKHASSPAVVALDRGVHLPRQSSALVFGIFGFRSGTERQRRVCSGAGYFLKPLYLLIDASGKSCRDLFERGRIPIIGGRVERQLIANEPVEKIVPAKCAHSPVAA